MAKTVTMTFPQKVLLTVEGNQRILFEQGIQEVPEEHADHPYLKIMGATRYEKKATAPVKQIIPGGGQQKAAEPNLNHKTEDELMAMKKGDLVDHALEHHDLELDPSDKKEDLVAAILDAQKQA